MIYGSKRLLFMILACTLPLNSMEFMKDYLDYSDEKPLPTIANDFVYGDGTTELTSQISEYENITAGKPIQGSIFVTHDSNNKVDIESFHLGDHRLYVNFVQTAPMSSTSHIVVSIYHFQLNGMSGGTHTLPPINVKVGGKLVRALPLTLEIPN